MNFRETIPEELVRHTVEMCGSRGEMWLDGLPRLIQELENEWFITIGKPFPSIEFNYVAEAMADHGQRLVIKIAPPFEHSEIRSEAKFLRVLNGHGAVNLIAEDIDRRSILIERALPGSNLAELFTGNELDAVGPAIDVLHVITSLPPDDKSDTICLDDWFDGLRRYRETEFPKDYAETALAFYEDLTSEDVPRFYLHGDFHPANVVSANRAQYLAIDPKGIIGPIGYDIGVFLNNFHWWQEDRVDVRNRLSIALQEFSDAFKISQADLNRWAFAQMVLGAWWTYDEMPETYQNEVAKADIWEI